MTKPTQPAKGGQNRQDEQNDLDKSMVNWTRVLGVATGLLFIATVITDIFVGLQWRAAVDAQNDTRLQLGASVTFTGGQQVINKDPGGKISYIFQPLFKNWGGTRTAHFRGWTSVKYFEREVPNSQDFSKPYNEIPIGDVTLGPGDVTGFAVSLPSEDAIKTKDKKGVAIIWGHVEWSGLYSPEDVGKINFCLKLVPVQSEGDANIIFQPQRFMAKCNTGMAGQEGLADGKN